jgi:peptidoglycan/LPS O-acetylase OafA/YrhL
LTFMYIFSLRTGIVNRLLSWKGFLPLGRVTYCVYLIHFDFLVAYYSAMRKRFYYTLFEQFTVCFGLLVMTFGIAFLVSVTLEASFLNLEKLIFSSKSKSNLTIISNVILSANYVLIG